MEKISSFFNFELKRNFLGRNASKVPVLPLIFTMLEFIMPLLLGISVGWLGTTFLEFYLSPKSAELQLNMAANIAAANNNVNQNNELADFLSANPFAISAYPVAANTSDTEADDNIEIKQSLATATLLGTFSNLGVWMQDNTNNKLNFISIGESFDVYKLTEVLYDRAIFQDEENNNVTKFFYLVAGSASQNLSLAERSSSEPRSAPLPGEDNIVAAGTNGQDGVVPGELIDNLVMNPFDEMKKFRIRPKFEGSESAGIEVQWLQNDSILSKLGVKKNDVMQSINGIELKNMGDIANAINSLMNGSRFDVKVMRDNVVTDLTYVVK